MHCIEWLGLFFLTYSQQNHDSWCNDFIIFLDGDGYEFYIVSLDNKQWHFEASNSEERDDWVSAIEQQILNSLQGNESSKAKRINNPLEAASIQSIRSRVAGNVTCVDCDAPSKFTLSLKILKNFLMQTKLYLQFFFRSRLGKP